MVLVIILIVCLWQFSKLRSQNAKIIELNYLIISLLDDSKKQKSNQE